MAARGFLSKLHGRTAHGVPRWAVAAAYGVMLSVLPSSLWRIAAIVVDLPLLAAIDGPPAHHGPVVFDGPVYVVCLSLLAESIAFLAFGLVSRWGEVFPRWIPVLGGRRVPPMAAVIPGAIGSAVLMVFPYYLAMVAAGRMFDGSPATVAITDGWQTVLLWVCYGPLALWGPLMAALTVHYHRRRRADAPNAALAAV